MSTKTNKAPLSVAETFADMRALNKTQHEVLRFLAQVAEPVRVSDITQELDLPGSTVRDNLAVLQESGLVERTRADSEGRGRPSWLYQATVLIDPVSLAQEFASFTLAAVKELGEASDDAEAAARRLGAAWGRQIIGDQNIPDHGNFDADKAVRANFDVHAAKIRVFMSQLGFEARPGTQPNQIDLFQCPFLDADNKPVSAVCQMHHGMLDQVIGTLSQGRLSVDLAPCAGPGFCQVTLGCQ